MCITMMRGKLSDRMYGKNLEDEDERGSNSLKDSGAARGKAEVDVPESKSETGASNAKSREANKKRMKKSSYGGEGKSEKSVADNAKEFLDKVREAVVNAATAVVETVASNPWVLIVVGVIAVLVLLCSFMLGSCGTFAGTMSDSTLVTTYTAYDEDITGVEKDYKKLEKELTEKIDNIESDYPDYDEYEYVLDEIGHNPFDLVTYLTVKYDDFKRKAMKDVIKDLFRKQYRLTLTPRTDIRTRKVPHTEYVDGHPVTTETEEEYEVKVLKVTLTNKDLAQVIEEIGLTDEERAHFELLRSTKGNKEYLFDDIYSDVDDDDEYHVPGEALSDAKFAAMIEEAEKYLGTEYVWGGSSPSTGFDCSGFVCWVINHSGWDVGRITAKGLKNYTATVSKSEAKPGDLIFFQGTYDTPGVSHVGIYVGDNMMLHCGNPIRYTSIDTNYWKNHFHSFGRLP